MNERTITLRSDLASRLEALAHQQGRTLDEVSNDLLSHVLSSHLPVSSGRWALALAEGMEAADIDWLDDPDASTTSRAHLEQHLREKWQRTQNGFEDA